MTNIYEKLKTKDKSNKGILILFVLSLINLISLNFFINFNLNYLFLIDFNYYLIIISLLAIFNFSLVIIYLIYDFDRFIILVILMMLIIYLNLKNLLANNYLLGFTLLGIFLLFQLKIYYTIEKLYKNNILIDWLLILRTSWNYLILVYLIFIFTILTFLPSLEKLTFQNIYSNLSKFDLFLNSQFHLDQKVVDLLTKNFDKNLPPKIKSEYLNNAIKELNNKFSIQLNVNSTLREAIAQYLTNQIDLIKKNENKSLIIKSIILFLFLIIIQPLFYLAGFLISYICFLLVKLLIYLKIFNLSYNQILKEQIEI